MGRRGLGLAFLLAGIATMAIGGVLSAMELGELYQSVAADPMRESSDGGDGHAESSAILRHVAIAALGVPFAGIGTFMLRRAAWRDQRGGRR